LVRPRRQPLDDHPGGRRQQDDVVELWVEPSLIRGAPGEEQDVGVLSREQGLDAVLAPDPVLTGIEAGRFVLGHAHHLGQPALVRIHRLVAERGQCPDRRRLAGARHAREQHALHAVTVAFALAAVRPTAAKVFGASPFPSSEPYRSVPGRAAG
jgi:hypothetical protein